MIAVLLAFGAQAAQAQQPDRTVEGTIVNWTAGGGDVAGQTVTLHRVIVDGFDDVTTTTDDFGAFRFDGIPYDPSVSYGVSVRYQDAIYGTDLDLAEGSPPPVVLKVYDQTHDDTVVSASDASLLFVAARGSDQTLAALEIITLANDSDRAYVPGSGVMELLRFGLPPGATDLSLDTPLIGADFVQVDRGFALLASVPPGEHDIMFSYRFPYDESQLALRKTYRYGAESLRILAPEEVVSITSDELGPTGSTLIGERKYQVIKSEGLTRGAAITVDMSGLPTASASQKLTGRLDGIRFEYAAPVVLVLLMLTLLIYGGFKRASAGSAQHSRALKTYYGRGETTGRIAADDPEQRAAISQEIVELTRSYEEGAITTDTFRQRLGALQSRLISPD